MSTIVEAVVYQKIQQKIIAMIKKSSLFPAISFI
jgi:hypothetical protein